MSILAIIGYMIFGAYVFVAVLGVYLAYTDVKSRGNYIAALVIMLLFALAFWMGQSWTAWTGGAG